ncbi:LysR family transcriptional regulator substrate-binding protein [Streptomyces sp. NPDC056002]|uniref:LysR family transcriptional regulator substrate-binding protein n=1 Tax=Streptomyces sp. NPDC056002 TaxID=3345675 RepID=UPI0035DA24F7
MVPGAAGRPASGRAHGRVRLAQAFAERSLRRRPVTSGAILIDPPPGPGVRLAADSHRAVLPLDHPLAGEPVVDIRDLEDDPFLISPNGREDRIRTIHRLAGLRFTPTHRVRDLATLISTVQAGIGVTVLSEVSRSLIPPDLALLPLHPQTSRRLVLTGPRARPWHPAVRTLTDSALDHLAGADAMSDASAG